MNSIYTLIHILTIFVTEIIVIYNYKQISNENIPIKSKTLIMLFIMSFLTYFNNYYMHIYIKFFMGIIITSVSLIIIFNAKIKEGISYSIIHALVYIILEIALSPVLMFRFENLYIFNNELYTKCIFSILIGIISIIIFKNKYIIALINKTKKLLSEQINILSIMIFIIVFFNFIIIGKAMQTNNIYLTIETLICIIFIVLMIRILINDRYNISILNERNNNLRESYKAYSKTIDDCKEFKHNIKNEIYSIKSLLSNENQEKINSIIKKYNNNYEWIDKLDEIPEGLQGLIYLKKKEAEQKKINIIINTKSNINIKNDYLDLCNTIGILIDNAIEASIAAKSKNIELIINNNKKTLNICIMNVFKNDLDLIKIGKKNYSTKEYKSGLGLDYIDKLKNQKIKVNFKIINNLFITNIEYQNKK